MTIRTDMSDLAAASSARFDWYQATGEQGSRMTAIDVLGPHSEGPPQGIPGANGYSRGWALQKGGTTWVKVYEGPNLGDHVLASGSDSAEVADLLRAHFPHRVSRADVCLDYPGGELTFARLRSMAETVALGRVVLTDYVERSPGGTASTLYVGAKSSEVRCRVYEKGKQDDAYPSDYVRGEVQVRPANRDRKLLAASLEPEAFWGMSRWARELRALMGEVVPAAPVRSARVSDLDRALDACAVQYGRRFLEQIERLEGDVEAFSLDLLARVVRAAEAETADAVTATRARLIREELDAG